MGGMGGLGGNNYSPIKPGGSHLAGQAAPVDISPSMKQQHPHVRLAVEGEVQLRRPVRPPHQIYTYTTHPNDVVCSVHAQS